MADDAINLSIADVEIVAAEPRIHDLKLAKALGFSDPHMIRRLITRHLAALESFGPIFRHATETSARGGRPGTDFYLTKKQALYITAKSNTNRAAMVTIEMVEVFDRATTAEPRADGPPYFPSCDAEPPRQPPPRPLPPPPEPPFCVACAAKALWRPGMDLGLHPLADGPLTAAELAFIVLLRGELRRREGDVRRDLIRRLSADIETGGGQ